MYTTEYLIEELQRIADEVDREPRLEDVLLEGRVSPSTFSSHFGTWSNALAAADVGDRTFDADVSEPVSADHLDPQVYVLERSIGGVRIGRSTAPASTADHLERVYPFDVTLLECSHANDVRGVQRTLEDEFGPGDGEGWLELTTADVEDLVLRLRTLASRSTAPA